ncbi:MAG: DUF1996 domain-containing protein, partial [Polyangiaceae bacterium]|nr:DUF1996 domain-containing protein [Polyangiaceae bacterium]
SPRRPSRALACGRALAFGQAVLFSQVLVGCGSDAAEESSRSPSSLAGVVESAEDYGPRDDGSGAFRTHCVESHENFDDPLVFPEQPNGAHHLMFFGNPGVDAFTTPESLQEAEGTTCDGVQLNRSAYWVPALYDASGERIAYEEPLFYYKTGYHLPADSIQAPPEGLRMIAGDAMAKSPQSTQVVKMRCGSWVSVQEWFDQGDPLDHVPYLPDCEVGDLVELRIVFPQSWDGENLDAPDHKSHMAYPSEATPPQTGTGRCPESHPVPLPEISYNFAIYVTEESGSPTEWRFSSERGGDVVGGSSAHGDWINGWDSEIMEKIVENCLRPAVECGVGLLGDGTRLRSVIDEGPFVEP